MQISFLSCKVKFIKKLYFKFCKKMFRPKNVAVAENECIVQGHFNIRQTLLVFKMYF
jgi:hypothetical protein